MKSQKEYWDKKISLWSYVSYGKKKNNDLIEKIATYFRSVDARKETVLKLLGQRSKGKIVIDLGCGLGEFAIGLLMRYKPKKVVALDISEVAIRKIEKIATDLKLKDKMEFQVAEISEVNKLPDSNFVVGLGFIDYLKPDQMMHLFKLIGDTPFLFSYFEKRLSFFNFLHKIYITLQKCPGAYKYTRQQIRSFMPKKAKLFFIKKDGLQFITNYKQFK